MPPFLKQSAASGNGGVWIGDSLVQSFDNPVANDSALIGFACARSGCPTFSVSSISDTLANTWDNIAVDSTDGVHGLGYALATPPGADAVTFVGTGFCGFTYDPCTLVGEVAGVSSFGSLTTFTGTSSVASGSVVTPQGTYNFATTTSYSSWILSFFYFVGLTPGTGIILAIPYVPNDALLLDTIAGWQLDSTNLHSGLYTTVVTPTPPARVIVSINTGSTKPVSSAW